MAVSQTWCIGSHAAQSAFAEQPFVGAPWVSVGHSSPSGTQLPQLEQLWPLEHPVLVFASHATQRPSSTRQVLRSPSQEPHSASLLQLWRRQIPSPFCFGPSEGPPLVATSSNGLFGAHAARTAVRTVRTESFRQVNDESPPSKLVSAVVRTEAWGTMSHQVALAAPTSTAL